MAKLMFPCVFLLLTRLHGGEGFDIVEFGGKKWEKVGDASHAYAVFRDTSSFA